MAIPNELIFFCLLREVKLPIPVKEHKFLYTRKFRFDYAWVDEKVALEVEGGVWTGGRHTSGAGFLKDMEKYNLAVIHDWKLIRCTPNQLTSTMTINYLRILLETK